MAHLLLHYGIATAHAHAVYHLVVGQHGAQSGAPVHHGFAQISNAVVHERLLFLLLTHGVPLVSSKLQFLALCHVEVFSALLLEVLYELFDGHSALTLVAIERLEHLFECPLRPVIILRVARAHLSVPVEREAYLVKLLPIVVYIVLCCDGGMLSCLYGILLGRQSVSVVAHGVEHVIASQALVAGVYVACYVAQGMAHMQPGSRWIRKHIEHVKLLLILIFSYAISILFHPSLLPFLLYCLEVIFHYAVIVYS